MRSTSPKGQDPVSIFSSALNLSVSQNSSDSDSSERDYYQEQRKGRIFSPYNQSLHHHPSSDSAVMDLSIKAGSGHTPPQHSPYNSLLKARGMTVSQALKSVRQANVSPKAGQNPPSSFEDNLSQTLGLMGMAGMNMTSLLSNLGNIKSTDLMAAAAAQQFISTMTASLQQQQKKAAAMGLTSGQTSSSSGSTSPPGNNNSHQLHNGNFPTPKHHSPLNLAGQIKQENLSSQHQVQQQPPTNNNNSSSSPSGGKKSSRKSWNPLPAPMAMATQLVNPATGKRRVQCAVCMKTFCDKGALKIHFSAVHLREMHKCTVAGCSMMFSSRRSRNRHSANPNPKLHSPHMRRKISPHDGRTAGPAINLNSPTLMLPPGMRYPHSYLAGATGGLSLLGEDDGSEENDNMGKDDDFQDDGQSLSGDDDFRDGSGMIIKEDEAGNNDAYMSEDEDGSFSSANEDLSSSSLRQKLSPTTEILNKQDGARKRKRNNPVRLPSVPDDSNDEFCCYDDGTVVGNGSSQSPASADSSIKRFKDEKSFEEEESNQERKLSQNSPVQEVQQSVLDLVSEVSKKREESRSPSPSQLKSLENKKNDYNHNQSPNSNEDDKGEEEKSHWDHVKDKDSVDHLERLQKLPIFSAAEANGVGMNDSDNSSEEMGKSDDDEGRSIGSEYGYIPIDRENPRKCSACGKEFQNQFGVKTHYQNVHLKLMHNCTVGGCNASFPSKRSRDRHSSNLNLHRKLLSTSPDIEGTRSHSRSPSPPSPSSRSTGSGSELSPRPMTMTRRPDIDFMATANTTTSPTAPMNINPSIFNPYIFRSNLILDNSLYIN